MTWIILALIATLSKAFANLTEKEVLSNEDAEVYVSAFAFMIAFLSLPLLFFVDSTSISSGAWLLIFGASLLSVASALTAAYVIKKLDVSESAGLFALSPLLVSIFAMIFLDESLGLIQIGGISLSIIGVYVLEHKFSHPLVVGAHEVGAELPAKPKRSPWIYIVLSASLILFSICTVADRYIIHNLDVDPLLFLVVAQFFILFGLFAYDMTVMRRMRRTIIDMKLFARLSFWANIVFIMIHRISHMFAVVLVEISVLNAFKQINAVFTTLLAGKLLSEKHILRRSLGCACIVAGVIAVVAGA